jgi:hypothetical protein
MGKNLVNLTNLKESMSLNQNDIGSAPQSQPVYIKASTEAIA